MGFIAALISTDKSLSKAQGLLLKAGVKMVYSLPFYVVRSFGCLLQLTVQIIKLELICIALRRVRGSLDICVMEVVGLQLHLNARIVPDT